MDQAVVAGALLDYDFRYHNCLHRPFARAHQQPNCPPAAGLVANKLAKAATALGYAARHPCRLFDFRPHLPGRISCYSTRPLGTPAPTMAEGT